MSQPKILVLDDIPQIMVFEKTRLQSSVHDEVEREMAAWHASWRQESLEHYLPLGWSFGIWDQSELKGYFLGQPQLFLRGMTQTLWVERLVAESAQVTAELVELAYRYAREKHFQKVLFLRQPDMDLSNSIFQLQEVSDSLVELKTAKF